MNVFLYELKSNIKSAIIWGVSLGLVGFFFISIFTSMQNDISAMNTLLENYPPQVIKALGLGENGLQTLHGFYSFFILYTILCASIQGLIMGIHSIGKESAGKTSDFLFTKPLSRAQLLLAKYAALMTCMLITSGIYFLITYFASNIFVENINTKAFLLLTGAFVFTQILFAAMGFCIGCFAKKIKSPTFVGIGIGSIFFAIEMVANMYDDRALQFISPMSYFKPSYIASNLGYDIPLFIFSMFMTIALTGIGFIRFKAKDIHST